MKISQEVLIFLVILVILGVGSIRFFYSTWFNFHKYREYVISNLERLPNWLPFRNIFLSYCKSGFYLWAARITSSISIFIFITLLIVVISMSFFKS
jgi:hypothetical protein